MNPVAMLPLNGIITIRTQTIPVTRAGTICFK